MKTPRREQPWYEARLETNSKPGPMSNAERSAFTLENRRILDDAPRLIAYGIAKGWISYPTKKTHFTWKPIDSSSTSTTLPWSSQSSGTDSIV
jgi:hypothetical protein